MDETHPVDDEQFSADVLACVASEKDDGAREVPGLAPPASGDPFRDLAQAVRIVEEFLVPGRRGKKSENWNQRKSMFAICGTSSAECLILMSGYQRTTRRRGTR